MMLIVLWTVALLALLSSFLITTARDRAVVAGVLRQSAALETAADGATRHAIYHLLDQSAAHWSPDGDIHVVRIDSLPVSVRLEDEASKVNPNTASMARLAALLESELMRPGDAAALAGRIIAWRSPGGTLASPVAGLSGAAGSGVSGDAASGGDGGAASGAGGGAGFGAGSAPGRPFRGIDELALVPGMTPVLLDRLRPRLTLFTGTDPDLVGADGGTLVVSIVAVARGAGNTRFVRHVVVRTNARRAGSRYEILMSELGGAAAESALESENASVMR